MNIRKQWLPITVSVLMMFFVALSFWHFKYRMKETLGSVIAADVIRLQQIFESIDKDCEILGFDYQKNPINFLNVKSFSGSEVGPMNLAYPDRWKGPYLPDNLVVENKPYQIVSTKQGYFITPGQEVKLPTGKIVGRDIHFDEDTDILQMMVDGQALYFENASLAAPLKLGQNKRLSILGDLENTEE